MKKLKPAIIATTVFFFALSANLFSQKIEIIPKKINTDKTVKIELLVSSDSINAFHVYNGNVQYLSIKPSEFISFKKALKETKVPCPTMSDLSKVSESGSILIFIVDGTEVSEYYLEDVEIYKPFFQITSTIFSNQEVASRILRISNSTF